jgi:hypothetical protein
MHAQHRSERGIARIVASLGLLLLQATLAAAAIASTSGICIFAVDRLTLDAATLLGLTIFALLIGVWMTVGLAHWRPFTPWLAFGGVVAILIGIGPLIVRPLDPNTGGAETMVGKLHEGVVDWGVRLLVLLMLLAVSLLGVPFGRLAREVLDMGRRARLARHRTRIGANLGKGMAR